MADKHDAYFYIIENVYHVKIIVTVRKYGHENLMGGGKIIFEDKITDTYKGGQIAKDEFIMEAFRRKYNDESTTSVTIKREKNDDLAKQCIYFYQMFVKEYNLK